MQLSYKPIVDTGAHICPRNWYGGIFCCSEVDTGAYFGGNCRFRVWISQKIKKMCLPRNRTSWDLYMLLDISKYKFYGRSQLGLVRGKYTVQTAHCAVANRQRTPSNFVHISPKLLSTAPYNQKLIHNGWALYLWLTSLSWLKVYIWTMKDQQLSKPCKIYWGSMSHWNAAGAFAQKLALPSKKSMLQTATLVLTNLVIPRQLFSEQLS